LRCNEKLGRGRGKRVRLFVDGRPRLESRKNIPFKKNKGKTGNRKACLKSKINITRPGIVDL